MDDKSVSTAALRRAINWLITKEEIKSDTELAEKMNLKKSTVSGYLSGKPSKDFVSDFEKKFNIKVADFEQSFKEADVYGFDKEGKGFIIQAKNRGSRVEFPIIKGIKDYLPDESDEKDNKNKENVALEPKAIEAILVIAKANEKLADSNQRLTFMLEEDRKQERSTGNDVKQMIEGALARHRAIQEVLQAYAKDGRPINVERFEADVNTRINEMVRADTTEVSIQSD